MMNLQKLLLLHACITLAAAVVLLAAPAAIPGTVHIALAPEQYLLSYFLAAAELAIAYLSFRSRRLHDRQALQTVVYSLMLFHAASGVLEGLALLQDASIRLLGNLALRILMVGLFYYYGPVKSTACPPELFI